MSGYDDYSYEERRREFNDYYNRLDEHRRQDSNDYFNRLDDQKDETRKQEEISEAFHKGLRTGDYSEFYWRAGLVPPDSTTDSTASTMPLLNQQPTALDQFLKHSTQLKTVLETTTCLPDSLTTSWIKVIQNINLFQPTAGLVIVHNILAEYELARYDYKPQRDIFDLKIYETLHFEQDMSRIKFELDWLKAILEHVENYLKNP